VLSFLVQSRASGSECVVWQGGAPHQVPPGATLPLSPSLRTPNSFQEENAHAASQSEFTTFAAFSPTDVAVSVEAALLYLTVHCC
jgi:hypothetical protein